MNIKSTVFPAISLLFSYHFLTNYIINNKSLFFKDFVERVHFEIDDELICTNTTE